MSDMKMAARLCSNTCQAVVLTLAVVLLPAQLLGARDFQVLYDLRVDGNVNTPYGGLGRYENLLKHAEAFEDATSGATWAETNLTVTANTTAAPDGQTTADTLTVATASPGSTEQVVTTTVTLPYAFSVWAKAGTGSNLTLELTTNGVSATTDSLVVTLESAWQRYSLVKTTGAGTSPTTVTARIKTTDVVGQTILVWGAQLEQASGAGTYVKTAATAQAADRGLVSNGSLLIVGSQTISGNLQVTGAGPHYISAGNVGIGTTSPGATLHTLSSGGNNELRIEAPNPYDPFLRFYSPNGTTEGFRIFYDNSIGDTYFDNNKSTGADTDRAITFRTKVSGALVNALIITHGGNIGIGTTGPGQKLHVEGGQCVTGDTVLAIAREVDGGRWMVDGIPIKDVQAGMLVYSLNEATGTLEPHRINGLLDMGVQSIYRLTTASGRQIRTTGNHPYLTQTGWRKVSELSVGEAIAVPRAELNGRVVFSRGADVQDRVAPARTRPRVPQGPRSLSVLMLGMVDTEVVQPHGQGDHTEHPDDAEHHDHLGSLLSMANTKKAERQQINIDQNIAFSLVDNLEKNALAKYPARMILEKSPIKPAINSRGNHPYLVKVEGGRSKVEGKAVPGEWRKVAELSVGEAIAVPRSERLVAYLGFQSREAFVDVDGAGHFSFQRPKASRQLMAQRVALLIQAFDAPVNLIVQPSDFDLDGSDIRFDLLQVRHHQLLDDPLHINRHLALLWIQAYHGGTGLSRLAALTSDAAVRSDVPQGLIRPAAAGVASGAVFALPSNFDLPSSTSDVAWDSITAIEPLSPEQVYDIEVDGTHNFVANGIIAHNTYLKGATADNTAAALNAVNSAATSLLYVRNDGNVGIGTTGPTSGKLQVEGGQCVTGDTLLAIAVPEAQGSGLRAQGVTIADVQAGMLVYSLNEATGQLEPHRINGLLNMGVKPVFRLTTESGRTIRTTGNHPYLVKVEGGGSNEEAYESNRMTSPSSSSRKVSSNTRNRELASFASGTLSNRFMSPALICSANKGLMRISAIPAWLAWGYWSLSAKSMSCVKMSRDSAFAWAATSGSGVPLAMNRTSWSRDRSQGSSLAEKFSSARKRMAVGRHEGSIVATRFDGAGRELQSRFDMLRRQVGIGLLNVGDRRAELEHLQHQVDHDPRALEARFAMADLGVNTNVLVDVDHGIVSIPEPPLPVNQAMERHAAPDFVATEGRWTKVAALRRGQPIAVVDDHGQVNWERILTIQPLSPEQVYDIEVDGTHNFVANGIIAHNTYLKGATADNTAAALNAVNSAATSLLYVRNDGNVGIGTTTPNTKLHIRPGSEDGGSVNTSATIGDGLMIDAAPDGSYRNPAYINFWTKTTASDNADRYGAARIESGFTNSGWLNGYITFQTHNTDAATWSNDLTIKAGKVGIGSTSPATALDVTGTVTATAFSGPISGNATTATALAANGANCSAGQAPLGIDASGAVESCTDFEEDLANSAGLLAALSDETGSGVAVFGTSPTFTTSVIMSDGATLGQAAGPLVAFDDTNNYLEITGANVGIGEVAPGSKLSVSGGATIGASYDTTAAPANGLLVEGNVGLGTIAPSAKLDVVGDVWTSGNVVSPYGGLGRFENLCTYSEDATNWSNAAATVTANNTTAPDGTMTADKLARGTPCNCDSGHIISSTPSTTYTYSIWLKAGSGGTSIDLNLENYNNGSYVSGIGNPKTVTISSTWQRYSISETSAASGANQVKSFLRLNALASSGDYIYAWGAQLEAAASPGVYVKTTSSAASASRGLVSNTDLYLAGAQTVAGNQSISGNLQVTGAGPHYISAGNVGIGTTGPLLQFHVTNQGVNSSLISPFMGTAIFSGLGAGGSNAGLMVMHASNTATGDRPLIGSVRARGTVASPLAVVNGDDLGSFLPSAYSGTALLYPAMMNFRVDDTVTTTDVPTQISFYTGSKTSNRLERVTIRSSGNVGIGSTSPATALDVTGTVTATAFSGPISGNATTATALAANGANCSAGQAPLGVDASGAVESCTDFEEDLANSAGLLAALSDETGSGVAVFGTSPTFTTSVIMSDGATLGQAAGPLVAFDDTNNYLEITGANVGIGTTAPGQKLHVEGQCVTGDTLLAIAECGMRDAGCQARTVPITDVQAGMLVYSLNEATGTLEPHQILGLLDMGVQPVFRLTTASGRTIRTTGNHPYLTQAGWRTVAEIQVGEAIAVPRTELSGRVYGALSATAQAQSTQRPRRQLLTRLSRQTYQTSFLSGQSASATPMQKNTIVERINNIFNPEEAIFPNTPPRIPATRNAWNNVKNVLETLSSLLGVQNAFAMTIPVWHGGAMPSSHEPAGSAAGADAGWDPIVAIEDAGREQVYDIEVEGTHNFVANGIIAHNTYLKGATADTTAAALNAVNSAATSLLYVRNDGNVGIGTTSPTALLDVNGISRLRNEIRIYDDSPTGRYGWGINAFELQSFLPSNAHWSFNSGGALQSSGTNELVRITGTGNVGIGTTAPDSKLHIKGTATASASNAIVKLETAGTETGGYAYTGLDFYNTGGQVGGVGGIGASYTTVGIIAANDVFLQAYRSGGVQNKLLFINRGDDAGTAGPIIFNQGGYQTTYERMRIASGGNVGIGTTAPASKMQVTGGGSTLSAGALDIQNSASTSLFKVREDRKVFLGAVTSNANSNLAPNPDFGADISSWTTKDGASTVEWVNGASGDGSTGYHRFNVASNSGWDRYSATGSITAASTTYDVSFWYRTSSGVTGNMGFFSTDSFAYLTNTTAVAISPSTDWTFMSFKFTTGASAYPTIGFYKMGNIGSGTFDMDAFSIKSASGSTVSPAMSVDSTGRVGIGTTGPASKLQINNTVSFAAEYDNGNSGTAKTVDWGNGNKQKLTLTGNCTLTLTAPGGPTNVLLKLVQDATGSRTVTWPAAVKWSGAAAPVLTTAANGVDFVTCYYDGTNYYCSASFDFR